MYRTQRVPKPCSTKTDIKSVKKKVTSHGYKTLT